MVFNRKKITNIIFYALLIVILFTPIGFHVKVFVNKIFSFSASVINEDEQILLTNYNWELIDENRNIFNFESKKNKVVLVNFWATWCPPCVAEMPSLQKLYTDYKDKVDFVFVAQDKVSSVSSYMSKNKYDFTISYSNSKVPSKLDSDVIPATYIIDKKGKIIVSETGAKNWNSDKTRELLDRLLNE